MKIRAAVVNEKGASFVFEELELQEPKANEIMVRVVASGICGTDEGARAGALPVSYPSVFGHEGAGIVEKIGPGVSEFEVGDHVAFSFAFCDTCDCCHTGHPASCENYMQINFGGTMNDGTTRIEKDGKKVGMFFGQSSFATHSIVNAKSAVKVDKDIDLGIAAPLGCGVQTGAGTVMNTFNPKASNTIAIFGCGAVGLSAVMGAKVRDCRKIIAVGGNAESLRLARELGATDTINRKEVADITEEILKITDGKGVNFAIDTSGYGPMIEKAIKSLSWTGTMAVLAPSGVLENFRVGEDILMSMRTIKGVNEGDSVAKVFIPEMLDLYKKGRFPIDKLITYYRFEDIEKALADSKKGLVIKPVLRISEQ